MNTVDGKIQDKGAEIVKAENEEFKQESENRKLQGLIDASNRKVQDLQTQKNNLARQIAQAKALAAFVQAVAPIFKKAKPADAKAVAAKVVEEKKEEEKKPSKKKIAMDAAFTLMESQLEAMDMEIEQEK